MDDNTRQVLVAAIAALGGLVTGVAVAVVGFRFAHDSEAARWEREDRARSDEAERARRDRWLDHRRDLYARLVGHAMNQRIVATYVRQGRESPTNYAEAVQALVTAAAEVAIISPALRAAADRLTDEALGIVASRGIDEAAWKVKTATRPQRISASA